MSGQASIAIGPSIDVELKVSMSKKVADTAAEWQL